MNENYIYGIRLQVDEPEQAAEWLCENLFFEREADGTELLLVNGGFHLILSGGCKKGKRAKNKAAPYMGINHAALETWDIRRALQYCRERGLWLEVNEQGGPRHSGKVYGTGMDYFNIISGFGFTIEVSQKLHCRRTPTENIIHGLEHVGVQVRDLDEAVRFYEGLGFTKDFEPVANESEDGPVRCCMVSSAGTTVELYAFERTSPDGITELSGPAVMEALLIRNADCPARTVRILKGSAGERVELWGTEMCTSA